MAGHIELVDQTLLPHAVEVRRVTDVPTLVADIQRLAVRCAPALGVVGALGVALVAASGVGDDEVRRQAAWLRAARPTAVNLAWGVDRALVRLADGPEAVLAEALAIRDGGAVVQYVGWRGIFIASIAISIVSFLMMLGTPESKVTSAKKGFDGLGLVLFIVGTLGLMIVLLFGSKLGWGSPITIVLAVVAIVAYVGFVAWERKQSAPFIDFSLFKNTTFTGATISNFLLNGTIGMLIVSQQLIQLAGCKVARDAAGACPAGGAYTAWDAGILTLGYGIVIIAFIRVGEKLLQQFGPRKPMIWGSLIVIVACVLLMMTHLLIGQYVILAIIAYCLFGLGLLRDPVDGRRTEQPAGRPGRLGRRHLQDGVLAGWCHRRRDLARRVHRHGGRGGPVRRKRGHDGRRPVEHRSACRRHDRPRREPDLPPACHHVHRDDGPEGRRQPRRRRRGPGPRACPAAPAGRRQGGHHGSPGQPVAVRPGGAREAGTAQRDRAVAGRRPEAARRNPA